MRHELLLFGRFFVKRFPLGLYSVYVLLLPAAVFCTLVPADRSGPSAQPSAAGSASAVVSGLLGLVCVLFFMRVVDEVKDLDYDRVFHPSRPLVTGVVGPRQVVWYLGGAAGAAAVLAAGAGAATTVTAALIMAYSLFLLRLEQTSAWFRDSMHRNIAVTIQLKTGVVGYAVTLAYAAGAARASWPALLCAVLTFVLAYSSWEVARKTVRPEFAQPGEKLYSTAVGASGSLVLAAGLLVAACVLRAVVAAVWQEWDAGWVAACTVPLACAVWGWLRWRGRRTVRYAPAGPALLGYVLFLAVPVAHWASSGLTP
ncbi:UbiA family prenyltransferase [Streptomyces sp. NPDC050619]|uniref:UbiA family prenyltransferase n=1 Tax=Streptomyces sp. NPDC050619 TaxID=3157214 RepID=UPI00342F083E